MRTMSIIIPCRNEVHHIEGLIRDITNQSSIANVVDIIISDGLSTDGTRELLSQLADSNPIIKIIDNIHQTTPWALNSALQHCRGEFIARMDVHASYPKDYLESLLAASNDQQIGNTGTICQTIPGNDSAEAAAIAYALSNSFGVGNSTFRTGTADKTYADTVPFGFFRRDIFKSIGLFDLDLIRNQDDELNARILRHGYKILLLPSPAVCYHARPTLRQSCKMLFQYGIFKPLTNKKAQRITSWRQFAPPTFVIYILVIPFLIKLIGPTITLMPLALYSILCTAFSLQGYINGRLPNLHSTFFSLLVFPSHHLAYGIGYIAGMRLLKNNGRKIERLPLSR